MEPLNSSVEADVFRGTAVYLPRLGPGNSLLLARQYSSFLKQALRQFGRPDVVHIQSTLDAGIFAFRTLKKLGLPYVVTEHATFFRRQTVSSWKLPLVRDCLQGAEHSFVVSSSLAADLKNNGIDSHVEILPNTYNSDLFRLSADSNADKFTFLSVCHLDKKKGLDVLLRALHLLHQRGVQETLMIAGDGPEMAALRRLAQQLGLQEYVQFFGNAKPAEVAELMHRSRCVVSASHVETFGITLIEAMACGVPALATRSGGPEDFVQSPHGLLVDKDDPESLCNGMETILNSTDFRISNEAQGRRAEYVEQRFSPASFYERVLPIYEGVAGSKSRRVA